MEQVLRVLMVGATGKYARLVVPELLKRGVIIRALVLDERKANDAREEGMEKRRGGGKDNGGRPA